ncbi:stealth conserved region 3 domain-containing protein [Yinghuangia sp. YIM S09857]|uniref:stealth family protein n=1 Tax=Yinghuangia sp. YIM S09857 TaxID=3436929 RepID=UPI003F53449A
MLNAENSPLVAAYRKALPEAARKNIARQMPHNLRSQVKRRVAALGSRASAIVPANIPARWAGRLAAEEWRAVPRRGRVIVARVDPELSPLRAREENLSLVVAALDDAGIDHFAVRGTNDFRSTLAVSSADWQQALAALLRCAFDEPLYASAVKADGSADRAVELGGPAVPRWAGDAEVVRITTFRTEPSGTLVLGDAFGCDLERWEPEQNLLIAPRDNRASTSVRRDRPPVRLPAPVFTQFHAHGAQPAHVRSREEFDGALPEDVGFPVDAVYTWVDGSDPEWRKLRAQADEATYHEESANLARYLSRDELRYSLRSLHANAPWIRHVYLVTADQTPAWLEHAHPRVSVVSHREIFTDPANLPTFNSHAIESQLHHIDGLSEHFLYFNDDMFLGRPVLPGDFFLSNGMTRFFPSNALVPKGAPESADQPVTSAGKNNRALIKRQFGAEIVRKMRHAPYALRRSVLAEIEDVFADEHRRTAASRFRDITDLSIASSLHQYYAYYSGRAVPGEISHRYLDLAHPLVDRRLGLLLAKRDRDAFCLNDTTTGAREAALQADAIAAFLDAYFPVASPFETESTEQ